MDIARGELVEAELDRLIEKRSRREPDPDELDPGYMESVRRHNERIQQENRVAWCEYHQGQAARLRANLEALISHHTTAAEKLRKETQPNGR
jgi:hypothetical protein